MIQRSQIYANAMRSNPIEPQVRETQNLATSGLDPMGR